MTHGLEIGSLDVVTDIAADEGYTIHVLGSDATFGSAQAVVKEIISMLADGDLATYDRSGNRVASFDVEITAPDGLALALGEKALRAELYKPNTVTWTPPSDFAPASVYEVITSEMSQSFDDLDEIRTRRIMRVTLTCSPFARSADLTTVDALPAGSTTTSVDTCDAATGWTGTRGGESRIVGTSDGSVWVLELETSVGYPPEAWTLTRTGTIDLSVTPYLVVETRTLSTSRVVEAFAGADTSATQMSPLSVREVESGRVEYVWAAPSGVTSLPAVTFRHTSVEDGRVWQGFHIYNIDRTDIPPGQTARQLTRVIEAGGTERTPASIHVASANGTDATGLTIVHTSPEDGSGYSPPLVRWRTIGTGSITADATAYSGNYEIINVTSWVAEVPTAALPEGGYVLMARLRCQTAATVRISYSTSTIFPDSVTQEGFTLGQVDHPFAVANEWELVKLDGLTLPSVRTAAGKVQIALQVEAATPTVVLDEAWLFRSDDNCGLTIVTNDYANLWLDSPDVDSPSPRVWVGDGVDTRVHPGEGLDDSTMHVLMPDGTAVFTAAFTDYPETDATFYRRWHSNAAS